ncbi:hypothetical protein KAR91_47465 [Candidatus Pacearchaeota archaeon]|nr:hypothetical protein [Candidatus Pacearchaeota archaeon]
MSKRADRKKAELKELIKKEIQSFGPEGADSDLILQSLLSGEILTGPGGLSNVYRTYTSQHQAIYRKYNGRDEFGNAQVRAVADIRTAFIAGEGLSVYSNKENESFENWVNDFLTDNGLHGNKFFRFVQGAELSGDAVFDLKTTDKSRLSGLGVSSDEDTFVRVLRYPTHPNKDVKYKMSDPTDFHCASNFSQKGTGKSKDGKLNREDIKMSHPMVLIIGGDDALSWGSTTKLGMVLSDCENYDRALKDIRRLNHVLARITPVWETKSEKETKEIGLAVQSRKWKIGDAQIGTAKFKYEVPTTGAHQNLESELKSSVKSISGPTGVPVHWFGFVDLMSNRATADSLYESVNNATIMERTSWATFIKEMIIVAQQLYIDAGGKAISKVETNFSVNIPLISFTKMLDHIKALSLAFADGAISIDDYRGRLPGINPLETKKAVEQTKEENMERMFSTIDKETSSDDEDDKNNKDEE